VGGTLNLIQSIHLLYRNFRPQPGLLMMCPLTRLLGVKWTPIMVVPDCSGNICLDVRGTDGWTNYAKTPVTSLLKNGDTWVVMVVMLERCYGLCRLCGVFDNGNHAV